MKRFHVHVAVDDLAKSVSFYSVMFGAEPSVLKEDYAKWMLDDPRINFAISSRGRKPGLDHLGLQVETESDLQEVSQRLQSAGEAVLEQAATTCCYAESSKAWATDPAGIPWETFLTTGASTTYGGAPAACATPRLAGGRKTIEIKGSCCAP